MLPPVSFMYVNVVNSVTYFDWCTGILLAGYLQRIGWDFSLKIVAVMCSCGFHTSILEEDIVSTAYCLCRFSWGLYHDELASGGAIIVFLLGILWEIFFYW